MRSLVLSVLLSAGTLAQAVEITHGPVLGHVTSDSIRVWARTEKPGTFVVRYGTEADKFSEASAPVVTSWPQDCASAVELKGLKAGAKYFCEVVGEGETAGPKGSFKTLPAAAQFRNAEYNPRGLFNFRFEFGSCANQNPENGIGHSLPLYTTMNREIQDKVHFAIMNGDWLYEEGREITADAWRQRAGLAPNQVPEVVKLAPTIVGVWENYKIYLGRAKNLAEWHRHVPSYFTFDDHELINDIRGCGTTGFRERRAVFRDIGIQAWYDYLGWADPVEFKQQIHFGRANLKKGSDVLVDADADFTKLDMKQAANLHVHWGTPDAGNPDFALDDKPGDPNAGVFEIVEVLDKNRLRIKPAAYADGSPAYSIGRRSYSKFRVANCEYYVLDCKTHRQMHDPANVMRPDISMLGKQQHDWLVNSMKTSDADFFFIVSSVNFSIPHSGAGGVEFAAGKDEAWTAMLYEREQLIKAWEEIGKPVFVLTADLHNSFAVKITDNVWEFASGPHNSVNHVPKNDEGDRPITGKFKSGNREVDIRWSSYILPDLPRLQRLYPYYCVAQINNVFNMPQKLGDERWVAYPHPQVIFQYFNGRTGEMVYSEAISLPRN